MRTRLVPALLVALAACGGDDGGSPDAPRADAPNPDSAPPDAIVPGPVTITVTAENGPVPGVPVVFTDPTGAVISTIPTDTQGRATEDVLPGSALTIAVTSPSSEYVAITYAGLEPGDDLLWSFQAPPPATVGDLSVSLPGAATGAVRYEVRLGCQTLETTNPAQPVTGTIGEDCLGSDQAIDVIALAFDATDALVGYHYAADVAVVTGGLTSVTLGAWQTALGPLTVTLTGAPGDATGAGMEAHFRVDGLDFGGPGAGGGFTGGTATLQAFYTGTGFVERLQYLVFVQRGTGLGMGVIAAGYAGTPTTASHDLAATLLPTLADVAAVDATGRVSLSWTPGGDLAATDGAIAMVRWMEGTDPHLWLALAPPGAASPYLLPSLPEAHAAWRPTASSVFDTPMLVFTEADYLADYRALRRGIGFGFFGPGALDALPPTGGLMRATLGGQLPGP